MVTKEEVCNGMKEAILAYDKAIEIEKDYMEAWFNKAVSHHNLEKPKAALNAYSRAIELNPSYAEAYFNRAGLFLYMQDKDKAKTDLEKAIELNPLFRQKALQDESLKSLLS